MAKKKHPGVYNIFENRKIYIELIYLLMLLREKVDMMKKIGLSLSEEDAENLEYVARLDKRSKSNVVAKAIEDYKRRLDTNAN